MRMESSTIYVDILSVSSVCALLFKGGIEIFWFDSSTAGDLLGRTFAAIGLLKSRPKESAFQLSEMRGEKGECLFFEINEDVRRVCVDCIREDLSERPLIKGLGSYFPLSDLLHFFIKTIEQEIREKIILINVAKCKERAKGSGGVGRASFLLEKGLWSGHMVSNRDREWIKVVEYKSLNIFNCAYYVPRLWTAIKAAFKRLSNVPKNKKNMSAANEGGRRNPGNSPKIAHWYTGKTITFDAGLRSDFFWLIDAKVKKEDMVLCFEKKELGSATRAAIDEYGIPNASLVTGGLLGGDWRNSLRLFFIALRNWRAKGQVADSFTFFYFASMFYFAFTYARWSAFFRRWNIKISVNQNDLGRQHVPMKLALKDRGGVSVSYQWSNLRTPMVGMAGCSDVMFSFSPLYHSFWKGLSAPYAFMINSGYITDHAFEKVKANAERLRKKLEDRGAQFIISYFDENSSNDRFSLITDNGTVKVHRFLLEKMIEDRSLGLILKPGYPNTFYKRLAPIKGLLDEAISTGRCLVMDKGQDLKTDKYPSEPALASDLSIGLLLSGTAALESALIGTKTVFLDLEKLEDPVYEWGRGTVVFDDIDKLFSAITDYRAGKGPQGFGDLSRWTEERDSFRDGNASARIGQYIGWLYEKLKQGSGGEEALLYANSRYAGGWGKEHVTRWG